LSNAERQRPSGRSDEGTRGAQARLGVTRTATVRSEERGAMSNISYWKRPWWSSWFGGGRSVHGGPFQRTTPLTGGERSVFPFPGFHADLVGWQRPTPGAPPCPLPDDAAPLRRPWCPPHPPPTNGMCAGLCTILLGPTNGGQFDIVW